MIIRPRHAVFALFIGLSGCMTYDPYTNEKQISKATTGAAIGAGVAVMRNGDNLILVMPANITFASGSSELKPDFGQVLNSVSLILREFNKTLLEITGHTDSTGSTSSNLQLSESRARSVSNSLQRNGVALNRMLTQGFGESRPIATNDTDSGRQQNRRVELVLVPITA